VKLSHGVLEGLRVRLEPLSDNHREPLREAVDADEAAWSIMVSVAFGPHFDAWWGKVIAGPSLNYAVIRRSDGAVVGVTGYHEISVPHSRLEIGGTYYRPEARGGAINPETKRLMLAHAFDSGAMRVEFLTDAINGRSRAALTKLGAIEEGVLRRHKVTWTGRARDTMMFSILADEWPEVRAELDQRLAAFT
jgi:RimJ/RimL family protein N-acetyltransferase